MKVDIIELRRRMAMRSHDQLIEIIANADGAYTASAVDVARVELASRPPRADTADEICETTSLRARYLTRSELVPIGVRVSVWLAFAVGVGSSLSLIITLALTTAGAIPRHDARFVHDSGFALISWWIIIAIKRRHVYGRMLLTTVVATWVAYLVILEGVQISWLRLGTVFSLDQQTLLPLLMDQQAAYSRFVSDLAIPVLALCYLALNRDVAAYFRHIRSIRVGQRKPTAG